MKKRFFPASVCMILLLLLFTEGCNSSVGNGAASTRASEKVSYEAFLNEIFRYEITENTINLHFSLAHPEHMGITDYEVTLGDISDEAYANSRARLENYLTQLQLYNKKHLSTSEQLTYDILTDYFTHQLKMTDYALYEEPLTHASGVHSQLPILFEEYIFYDEKDVQDYLELLSQVDDYFVQIMKFEKEKAAAGLFMSDYSCQKVIDQCNDFIASAENHFLIQTFAQRIETLEGLSQEEKYAYLTQNEQLVKNELVKAYQYLADELTVLLGSGTNDGGLCYFPEGKAYYEQLYYYYTGCSDEIIDIQEAISKQREQDMLAGAQIITNDKDFWNKFDNAILDAKDPNSTLKELQTDMLADFPVAPDTSCTVDIIDECLEDYVAPAYYITAPIDNYVQNSIHINDDYDTTSINYFTTLAHEGFPGHLYQTVMTYEADILPVRHLTTYCGYIEGWATYVEMLSYAYADIDPTVASVMQKNQAATLSLYASTDIGIHYDGWTLEDTKQFWSDYGITDSAAISNIYRYIAGEPGNYLQYYVGYLKFLEFKEHAKKTYGTSFDEIAFHQAILEIGPAPFDMIKEYFNDFYKK